MLDVLSDDPRKAAHLLDWVAKYNLMEGLRTRLGAGWDHPKLALIDIQYSDIDPARGLYHALVRRGSMRTLVTEEEVDHAVEYAPESTRAYVRGHSAPLWQGRRRGQLDQLGGGHRGGVSAHS